MFMLQAISYIVTIFASIFFPTYFAPKGDQKVVIIGTNDIHGTAFPTQLFRSDTNEQYQYGGLVYMARLIEILQDENPGKTLILDAGDQFQGGIESSSLVSSGQIINDFYKQIGTKGIALGNHQFDFGPSFLFDYLQNRDADNMAANLRSETGEKDFLHNQKSSQIYQVNGLKIGVIGLSTLETLTTTDGFTKNLFPKYQFLPYKDIVIEYSSKLRSEGADIVVIVSHVGNDCEFNFTYGNWTKSSPQQTCYKDQITNLLDSIPQGTVDAVVQGHRHRIVHYFHNDIPIIGVINGGYYFNALHITFDKQTKKIKDIFIQGPIPVCEKIFQNTKTCNYLTSTQLAQAGNLINWQFHGQDVYAQPALELTYQTKWKPSMSPFLVDICKNQVYMYREKNLQSQLGNLITSMMHQAVPDADFVILNPGIFRTAWIPGMLQYQHFYSMFPFQNLIQSFDMTGKELLDTLNVIQSGTKGFYQIWNLYNQVTITADNQTRTFVSAKFYNGTEINNSTVYKGVSVDFLLSGGDDFSKVMGIVYNKTNLVTVGDFRPLIQPKLQALGNIALGAWIDPNKPRLDIKIV